MGSQAAWNPIETCPMKEWVLGCWTWPKNGGHGYDVIERLGHDEYRRVSDYTKMCTPTYWMEIPAPQIWADTEHLESPK